METVGKTKISFIEHSKYATPEELYRDVRAEHGILSITLITFDTVRELHGSPLRINSGRRSQAHQLELKAKGYKTATYSPHVYGAALDVAVPEGKTDEYLVALIFGAAQLLEFPTPRVGWKLYRKGLSSTFVHFDYAFLLPEDVLRSLPDSARRAYMHIGGTW